jgi:hypothetical protein
MTPLIEQIKKAGEFKPTVPIHRQTEYDDGMEYQHAQMLWMRDALVVAVETLKDIEKTNHGKYCDAHVDDTAKLALNLITALVPQQPTPKGEHE